MKGKLNKLNKLSKGVWIFFENYKTVWYTTLFFTEGEKIEFPYCEMIFLKKYKFHHFEKIEFPY